LQLLLPCGSSLLRACNVLLQRVLPLQLHCPCSHAMHLLLYGLVHAWRRRRHGAAAQHRLLLAILP
jgi:hypothetical protein